MELFGVPQSTQAIFSLIAMDRISLREIAPTRIWATSRSTRGYMELAVPGKLGTRWKRSAPLFK